MRQDSSEIDENQQYPSNQLTGDYYWASINGITLLNAFKTQHNPSAVQSQLEWTPRRQQLLLEILILYTGLSHQVLQHLTNKAKIS